MTDEKSRPSTPPLVPASTPDASERPVPASTPDASERLVRAEGADVPHHADGRRRRRRSRRPGARASAPPASPIEPTAVAESDADRPGGATDDVDRPGDPTVAERIRELEARLDQMIVARERERATTDSRPPPRPLARSEPPPVPSKFPSSLPPPPEGVLGTARELLSTDFYLRQWGRLGMRDRSEEVDEFGYDPAYEQRVLPVFDFLYDTYFRVEMHGVERIPAEGRCLLVANHSGTLPVDGMMLRLGVRREHPDHREVRWLAEDAIFHFPFLGSFTNRMGAVRACQENAERLLDHGALVAVFPEGMKGIGKLFRDRYKLQRFGRGGFVRLCMRTRTPVVPVAIIGSEETNPMLARVEHLARAIGLPYLPVTPTFPLLGPLGLLPAPTKWKMYFGEPIDFTGYGAESADDEILVGRVAEGVRAEIQSMLDRAIAGRRSVWFG
jgi:1-acyl-sn-glycerol-3-phosphate acyltransferase